MNKIPTQKFLIQLGSRSLQDDAGRFPFLDGSLSVAGGSFSFDVSSGMEAFQEEATAIGHTAGSPCNRS